MTVRAGAFTQKSRKVETEDSVVVLVFIQLRAVEKLKRIDIIKLRRAALAAEQYRFKQTETKPFMQTDIETMSGQITVVGKITSGKAQILLRVRFTTVDPCENDFPADPSLILTRGQLLHRLGCFR